MKTDTTQENPYGTSPGAAGSSNGMMVSYAHKDDPTGVRFVQRSEDPLPVWAVDITNMVNEDGRAADRRDWDMEKLDELLTSALVRIKGRSNLPAGIVNKIKQLGTYIIEEDPYAAQRIARAEQRRKLYGTPDPRSEFEKHYPDMIQDLVWVDKKYVADYVYGNYAQADIVNKMLETWIAATIKQYW